MKNKTTISVLIIVLAIAGLLWWGRSAQKSASANPNQNSNLSANALQALETSYDFGKISMTQGKVEKIFEVSNTASEDITLEKVTTSCMCTVAYLETAEGKEEKGPFGMIGHGGLVPKANEVIKPGESREVRVVFDPNAHGPAGIGAINRVVTLEDNLGRTLEFQIKAVVTP
ncbi:MAG: hypothetical protein A3G05_00700 [Candidatus Zambryskibacteria bacterium RIFCSPLOWO2_12_FULL_45_14]|uniref:DUF1573 domain-containing protein n=2 Tax=Candidatus Zambryskiibacteriota TaxID=1817925 RepID=A0A1G2UMV8_9BACT|nr:MAG: hypothetical protein A3H60_01265 [Candidatus Zambryskibacteria bacterium RIFCSPLOWO2_02_FULL_44_12b]OHB14479.1 MAG: hypothetical protein A3G05_00700 [Candidatus Zambryskibacteria bacterium RIFCSPLOWO2_12_FULL_45_14]